MNLIDDFDEAARATPQRTAIIDHPRGSPRALSFAQLQARSARLAALLAGAHVQCGDGIVVLVPMSAELYVVIAAALRIGAVPVFVEPRRAQEQLARCRGAIRLRAFVGTPAACLFRLAHADLRTIPIVFVTHGWMPGATSLAAADCLEAVGDAIAVPADAPAMLTFTAGSTGAPKGVLRTHRLLKATEDILARQLDLRPGSINLATMPALVMVNLARGVTSLIPPGDLRHPGTLDPRRIVRTMARWQCESLLASPALVEHLCGHCLQSRRTLDTLRAVFIGGAPVTVALMDRVLQVAPAARVVALYGSTEAEPMALVDLRDIDDGDRAASAAGAGIPAGTPIAEIRLAVLQDHWGQPLGELSAARFRSLEQPRGKAGEIVVCGPHVARGYLAGRGDRENKFRVDGEIWHRTGDAGSIDPRGRLWLVGRCAARLAGEPAIYPLMVEAALSGEPGIARSAFLDHAGRRVLALELKDGAGLDSVQPALQALAWAGIEQVVRLRSIPVDARHNAKTDYPALHSALDSALVRMQQPATSPTRVEPGH